MSSFQENHLADILAFFESALPGEMPNALMDQLTRYLHHKGKINKAVNLKPSSSDYIHDYGSDSDRSESESDLSESESDSGGGDSSIGGGGSSSCRWTPSPPLKEHTQPRKPRLTKSDHSQCKAIVAGTGERCLFRATKGKYCGHHKK